MQTLTNFYHSIPASSWNALFAFLLGSTVVATALQVVKHWFNLSGKKLISFLLGLFSFLAAGSNFLISSSVQNPNALGRNTATILAIAFFVHRFAVSPLYEKITTLVNDANNYRATTAAQPAAPVETPQFTV